MQEMMMAYMQSEYRFINAVAEFKPTYVDNDHGRRWTLAHVLNAGHTNTNMHLEGLVYWVSTLLVTVVLRYAPTNEEGDSSGII